mmetsp:Transcript_6255/g.17922  ORF Transcript_6255/g.17922 Transcript_6255/m.17922 type:complete len:461 (-) Transcript_6255:427-1809(-)
MAHGSMVEVLPGKLFWAPLREAVPEGFKGDFVQALELCKYGAQNGKSPSVEYNVMHYSLKAAGRAFGPLGLDVTLRFCRGLDARMRAAPEGGLAVGTTPGDINHRTNVSVMLGAYLQIVEGWSVDKLVEVLGAGDADLAFACSWARKDRPEGKRNMTVRDCWAGLAMALEMGWLAAAALKTDDAALSLANRWRAMVATYDCSWIIPGFVLVGADPITTALDPNPATFSLVFPMPEGSVQSVAPPAGAAASPPNAQSSDEGSGAPARGAGNAATICKEFGAALSVSVANKENKAHDFMTILKNCGVSTIIRTNFAEEPGMPKTGGYDAEKVKASGFSHSDVLIVDTHGGLPKKADVEKALRVCPDGSPGAGAIYVHCKGGFGRSIVLACCLAVERLDIPGSALLGWVRMVRPGCVNTPQQEMLLKSFRGRNDVRRFAGLPPGESKVGDAGAGGQPACCAMQ